MLPARVFIEVQVHGLRQTNRASIKRNPKQFRAGGSWASPASVTRSAAPFALDWLSLLKFPTIENFCCSAIGGPMEEAGEWARCLVDHQNSFAPAERSGRGWIARKSWIFR